MPRRTGRGWAKFSEGLNPGPPDLKDVVGGLEPRELFWVVKNGIKMTGMPSFGAIGVPDEEIWSIVAFLEETADRLGGGLQGVEHIGAITSSCQLSAPRPTLPAES